MLLTNPLSEKLYSGTGTMKEERSTEFYTGATNVGAAWIIALAVLLVMIALT